MPEYLAPGVFVEETSFRAKSIEGVGTSTAAFVGLTSRGPRAGQPGDPVPTLLTSFVEFERIYGGVDDLRISDKPVVNYLAHAARAFFNNGGGRLYVARVLAAGNKPAAGTVNPSAGADKKVKFAARTSGGARIGGTEANFRVVIGESLLTTTKKLALKQQPGTMVKTPSGANAFEYYVLGAPEAEGPKFKDLAEGAACELVTLHAEVYDPSGLVYEASGLGLAPTHSRYIGSVMGAAPPQLRDRLTNPVAIEIESKVAPAELREALAKANLELKGGVDGTGSPAGYEEALNVLLALEDISIIAAPGLSTFDAIAADVHQKLIGSAEKGRAYRIAVLDTPPNKEPGEIVDLKGKIDSTKAALYYPWISVANPAAATDPTQPQIIDLPPSGHVAGIYARTDIQRGVWKAPANETVTGAIGLQRAVSFGEQERLNPLGINCIRALPNRGIRVWGARTISSDPEWKYVNIRRYFLYLEASIDRGTQWAVFEPNGERLWANVRTTISDFLYNEWINGALLGTTPKEAFFVQCDRSTMTQNDLDNGRLICLIGVAAIKPAEFVIFRIGQKTADARG
ncbi:MAG TPA: phage tail sheath subtilisin-like domain-containing protein [Croceibacterium sp.]